MASFLTLQSVDAVLARIKEFFPVRAESLPLERAFCRTLAGDFIAAEDLPGFDRSSMDGFAVRARDVFGASEGNPSLMAYVGECPMGECPALVVGPGQAARIWTGGMMPPGADAVVMLEYSREAGEGQIELTRAVAPGENVILRDEDASKGDILLEAGCVLRAQEIGLLAALGQAAVSVRERPKVGIISSGDEVLPVHETLRPGQVRDVNSYTLAALCTAAGAETRFFGLVRDDRDKLREALQQAADWSDVVLLSGGSSAGQRDYTVYALAELPGCEILVHGVAISPGKPLILARQGDKSLWGLPGHAASALVCAEVFIRPLLSRLLGHPEKEAAWRAQIRAELTRSVASAQGRRDYIRVALAPPAVAGGPLLARPVMGKSGLISTLVQAEALVVCPEDREGLSAGTMVDVLLLL